jgi:hypothetical protein
MGEITPASEAIAGLLADGWNYAQIGKVLGVNPSYVRQAINPSPGQKQKPMVKYVSVLQGLQGRKPGAKPGALPEKRVTKAGKPAGVRKGVKTVTTRKGVQHTIVSVRKGPATLKRAIRDAAKSGKRVRWDIHYKKLKVYPDQPPKEGWASGHLPPGWDAQKLIDRIENPQESDGWKPGDVNGALTEIIKEQNPNIYSALGADQYNLFTTDN